MKRIIALILSAYTAVILAGCGDTDGTPFPVAADTGTGSINGTVSIDGMTDLSGCLVTAEMVSGGQTQSVTGSITASVAGDTYSAVTAEDGSFTIDEIPAGIYSVTATRDNTLAAVTQSVVVPMLAVVTVDITLTATGSVSGIIDLDQAGADLRGSFAYAKGTSYVAGTDETGAFVISDIPIGTYTIVLYHDGYGIIEVPGVVVVAATDTPLSPETLAYTSLSPVISSVTAAPFVIAPGDTVSLEVDAFDPEGDALAITWTCTQGSFSDDTGPDAVWTAPAQYGVFIIEVAVSDGPNTVYGQVAVQAGVDMEKPVITDFTLTSDTPTFDPLITFTLEGSDDIIITGWMITETPAPPAASDPGWLTVKPTDYTISAYGETTLYAWAKDAFGRVSELYDGITVLYVITSMSKNFGGSEGDVILDISKTSDFGYILIGNTYSNDFDVSGNHGAMDVWVAKLDANLNIEWQRCYGGFSTDSGINIKQTADGGYIMLCETWSNDGDVLNNPGGNKIWFVKLDSSGNIQWQKCYGGSSREFATNMRLTSDGGYIIVGSTNSNDGDITGNHGGYDILVLKLDSSGNIQWQKCYGGSNDDNGNNIEETTDGGFVICGTTLSNDGNVTGNHGNSDIWIVKINSTGAIQWKKCYGGSFIDKASSIKQTDDNGYIFTGLTQSTDGDVSGGTVSGDIWLVKINILHAIQWQRCFDFSYYEAPKDMINTIDDGYAITGLDSIGFLILKTDGNGEAQWQKSYGGSGQDTPFRIIQTFEGGFIVGGSTNSNDGDILLNYGSLDGWLIKLDTDGNL